MQQELSDLLASLDRAQPTVKKRDRYYRGEQPLKFLKDTLSPVMSFRSNLAEVAVSAVAERINLENLTAEFTTPAGAVVDYTEQAKKLVQDSDFPMTLQAIISDMLAVGSAYILVWEDEFNRPVVTGESAENVICKRHPVTGSVVSAVKRWQVVDHNNVFLEEHVIWYRPDNIQHFKRGGTENTLNLQETIPNNLGVVPVVPAINFKRLGDSSGASVIDSLAPLLDALNKLIVDMLTTSESVARPKRYATGVVLEDSSDGFIADEGFSADYETEESSDAVESPFKDSDDLWISEQAEAKFGQLAGADLGGYQTAVNLIIQQIMAVSSLPGHMVGVTTGAPSTAEALRASEVALSSTAAGRIKVLNRPIEWAIRLLVALDSGVSPDKVKVKLKFADTATRSIAQEADATVKLTQENIISPDEARSRAGVEESI